MVKLIHIIIIKPASQSSLGRDCTIEASHISSLALKQN